MKRIIFLIVGISMISVEALACDICSIYINLEPNDLKNSFGFNYRYRSFEHSFSDVSLTANGNKHAIGNTVISNSVTQEEIYNNYDLWFNYFFYEKWQLNATMTFADNYYLEDDSLIHNIAGPGDLTLVVKNILFNTKSTDTNNWAHRFILGGGIKIPIGKYNQPYMVTPQSNNKGSIIYGAPYSELDPHLQTGSGSLDFIFLTEYLVRFKKTGIITNVSYRINTENSNQFKFANRLNINSSAFYIWNKKDFTFTPNMGVSYEFGQRDQLKNRDYSNSGGEAIFLNSGLKIYYKKMAFGVNYQNPINQNLNDNQLQNKNRVTSDLTFYF